MASFDINVGDKKYTMFYDRDSIRQFENMDGKAADIQNKIVSTTDKLFYVGLRKFHSKISVAESQDICNKAIDEFGIDEVYAALVEAFSEVFTQGGNSSEKKRSFLVKKLS